MTQETAKLSIKHPNKGTRAAQLVAMLSRKSGATLDNIVNATNWKPHTARAALTGLKKRGYKAISEKLDGTRIYRIAGAD